MFKRTFHTLVLALLIVAVGQAYVQAKENALKAGAWALQFRVVTKDKNLTSYEGTTLSIKRHTSANWAWKLGVSATLSDKDRDRREYQSDSLYRDLDDNDNSGGFKVVVQRLWYPKPKASPTMFIGLGPLYEHSYNSALDDDGNYTYWRDRSSNSFGLAAVIGMELFVSRSISFSADYSSTLKWTDEDEVIERLYKDAPNQNRTTNTSSNYVRLYANSVRVGLSLYF